MCSVCITLAFAMALPTNTEIRPSLVQILNKKVHSLISPNKRLHFISICTISFLEVNGIVDIIYSHL